MLQLLEQTYNRYWVDPTVHVLLTTDNPTSEHILAWSHKYENSRIVHIELGPRPDSLRKPELQDAGSTSNSLGRRKAP